MLAERIPSQPSGIIIDIDSSAHAHRIARGIDHPSTVADCAPAATTEHDPRNRGPPLMGMSNTRARP